MPPFNKFLGKIQIPMRLDLAQTNISFTNQEFCYKYILKCVVFHIGKSVNTLFQDIEKLSFGIVHCFLYFCWHLFVPFIWVMLIEWIELYEIVFLFLPKTA